MSRILKGLLLLACCVIFFMSGEWGEQYRETQLASRKISGFLWPSWTDFQKGFTSHTKELSDQSLGHAQQLAEQGHKDGVPVARSLPASQWREWVRNYAANDMEPFLSTICLQMPREERSIVRDRMMDCKAPHFAAQWFPGGEAAAVVNRHTVVLCPPYIGESYEQLRDTISHELIHYCVQGGQREHRRDFLREGVTEFLTISAATELGWNYSQVAYEDEVLTVSLLWPVMREELLAWYVASSPDDILLYKKMKIQLTKVGISSGNAQKLVEKWEIKNVFFQESQKEEVEISAEAIELSIQLLRLEQGDEAFSEPSKVAQLRSRIEKLDRRIERHYAHLQHTQAKTPLHLELYQALEDVGYNIAKKQQEINIPENILKRLRKSKAALK